MNIENEIYDSVWTTGDVSLRKIVYDSVRGSVQLSVFVPAWRSVYDTTWRSVCSSIRASVNDSIAEYEYKNKVEL